MNRKPESRVGQVWSWIENNHVKRIRRVIAVEGDRIITEVIWDDGNTGVGRSDVQPPFDEYPYAYYLDEAEEIRLLLLEYPEGDADTDLNTSTNDSSANC
jgi:hypothetical protein